MKIKHYTTTSLIILSLLFMTTQMAFAETSLWGHIKNFFTGASNTQEECIEGINDCTSVKEKTKNDEQEFYSGESETHVHELMDSAGNTTEENEM